MFESVLEQVHSLRPLVHCITNYVTANDCANLVLACGASPVMADEEGEVAEITARSAGLCLNLGTLQQTKVPALLLAGKTANACGIPAVLDPVGAGASTLRTQTALRLLCEIRFSVIRGNASELRALALGSQNAGGVDAELCDRVTEQTLPQAIRFAKTFAQKTGAVIAMTGAIDIVADAERAFCIRNGHPMMAAVTGSGCQLSVLTASFVAANPEKPLLAAAAAVCAMGLAGQIAHTRLGPLDGSATYRNFIIDAIYNLTPEQLEGGANYEMR